MKFDWKVGNKYKTRNGSIMTMLRFECSDFVVFQPECKPYNITRWLDNGCQNKDPERYPDAMDIMSEVSPAPTVKVGDKFKNGYGNIFTLVAITTNPHRPNVLQDTTGYVYSTLSLKDFTKYEEPIVRWGVIRSNGVFDTTLPSKEEAERLYPTSQGYKHIKLQEVK